MDCLGGDHSPAANVEGALLALSAHPDLSVVFFGEENAIRACLADKKKVPTDRMEIVDAPMAVSGEDAPIDAIRMKKESSMISAIRALREDDALSALVSCGASGVLVGASILRLGRIEGVRRPPFCPILPTMNGGIVGVCDSGANVETNAEGLLQNALLGSAYLSAAYGIENPRVALLNVGVESEKGDDLHREAYGLLSHAAGLNFVGNMESRDLLSGKYDLVVADGFSGNVLIKSTEGACLEMLKKLKRDISSSFLYKLGALFLYPMFKKEKKFMNYQNYGGSVLLGLEKVVVKGHGSSRASAVSVSIDLAYRMVNNKMNEKIAAALAATQKENENV
ncbi:MAG TPA: phosphate acyltransferase PlsX [Clostridiales bacterium]|nr:phosphate acyltransferase PlsX [Clostridiales bacterium]